MRSVSVCSAVHAPFRPEQGWNAAPRSLHFTDICHAWQLIKIHRSPRSVARRPMGCMAWGCGQIFPLGFPINRRRAQREKNSMEGISAQQSMRARRSSFRIYQSLAVPFIRGNPISIPPAPRPSIFKDSARNICNGAKIL